MLSRSQGSAVAKLIIALKRIMEGGEMELDIIVNPKTTDDGQAVIQVRG